MKNILNNLASLTMAQAIVLVGVFCMLFHKTSTAETIQPGISFQVFYDELMPYGDWISHPVHGFVWVPYAEPGFQPYATNGYWVMTNFGNTWVSNYDWGWAPFHYGRWYFDDYVGWAWVPGYEWGPAWVNWRTGGDYYGWAPLMPGISIHLAVNIPTNYWVFVPRRRLISRNIYNYYVPRRNVYKVYSQTTVINNTYVYNNTTYISGPARRDVERVTRRTVPVYQVNNSERPGRTSVSRNAVQVYQPTVRQTANNSGRDSQARPARIVSADEHKVNLASRNNSRSAATRTAPTNSRTTNNRTTETRGSEEGVTRRVEARTQENGRTNIIQNRVSTPSQSQRATSGYQRGASPQPRQQPSEERQNSRQTPSTVNSRTQAPQQRSAGQVAPATQRVQTPRQNAPGGQEVRRSTSSSRVAPSAGREASRGSAERSSSQSRRTSRGNN